VKQKEKLDVGVLGRGGVLRDGAVTWTFGEGFVELEFVEFGGSRNRGDCRGPCRGGEGRRVAPEDGVADVNGGVENLVRESGRRRDIPVDMEVRERGLQTGGAVLGEVFEEEKVWGRLERTTERDAEAIVNMVNAAREEKEVEEETCTTAAELATVCCEASGA